VLEGSVRKSERRLRITAQLINVENGFHIWSQTYDREMDDIFAIQDDISKAVVAALRISILGEAPQARETDPDAFTAYLNALHFYQKRTNEGYEKALSYSQQAIDIDPNYAPAWNLLSSTYSNQALTGRLPHKEAHEKALLAVERALEIDPDYAFANSARAWLAMRFERDYATAAAFYRRALDLAPDNPVILGNRAVLAFTLGHVAEAIEISRKSLALDPISSSGYSNLSDQLAGAGRPVEAIEAAQKAVELMPGNATARVNLAAAYLLAEQPEKAIVEIDKSGWDFYQLYIKALAYHVLGQVAESDDALIQMTEQYANARAFRIASVYAWRNDLDAAFQWLDRAVSEGQSTGVIKTDPFTRNLHDDARWDLLLARLGLSDDQVAAIAF
jgi:tetratricopeptide (TPR) repeat protein